MSPDSRAGASHSRNSLVYHEPVITLNDRNPIDEYDLSFLQERYERRRRAAIKEGSTSISRPSTPSPQARPSSPIRLTEEPETARTLPGGVRPSPPRTPALHAWLTGLSGAAILMVGVMIGQLATYLSDFDFDWQYTPAHNHVEPAKLPMLTIPSARRARNNAPADEGRTLPVTPVIECEVHSHRLEETLKACMEKVQ